MTDELPPGWARSDIGTLGRYINGRGFGKAEWKKQGLPIIRIQNLNDESADFNYSDVEHADKYRVEDGDLLVAWAASLGVYLWNRGPAWLNQHIFRVEVEERAVTKPFLYYALSHALEALYKKTHGSGMVHVTKDRFDSHPISLPPLNEQARIASKIDELFSRIEEGERALERVQKLVERYRQSVLKAAVTGELTRAWRKKNKGQLESGEALLARILKARREAWEKAELGKMRAKGSTPADDKWKRRYAEPPAPDPTNLPLLPDGWCWATADQLCSQITDGEHIQPRYQATGRPMLSAKNVRYGYVDFGDVDLIGEEDFAACLRRCAPTKDDVLIVSVGATTGRAGIVGDCEPFAVVRSVLLLRPLLLPKYLLTWIQSPWCQQHISRASGSSAQAHLYIRDTKRIPVPLPPQAEMLQVMDCVERQLVAVAHLLPELAATTNTATALRQAVLRESFSGRLVSQDPNDESATALLARIASERAGSAAVARRGLERRLKAA